MERRGVGSLEGRKAKDTRTGGGSAGTSIMSSSKNKNHEVEALERLVVGPEKSDALCGLMTEYCHDAAACGNVHASKVLRARAKVDLAQL